MERVEFQHESFARMLEIRVRFSHNNKYYKKIADKLGGNECLIIVKFNACSIFHPYLILPMVFICFMGNFDFLITLNKNVCHILGFIMTNLSHYIL